MKQPLKLLEDSSVTYLYNLAQNKGPVPENYLVLDLHLEQIQRAMQTIPGFASAWPAIREHILPIEGISPGLLKSLLLFGRGEASAQQLRSSALAFTSSRAAQDLRWGAYLCQTPVFAAWRQREHLLKAMVSELLEQREWTDVLYWQCGQAEDLRSLYDELDPWRVRTLAIEPERNLLQQARKICRHYGDDLRFRSCMEYVLEQKGMFDLIWVPWCLEWQNTVMLETQLRPLLERISPGGRLVFFHIHRERRYQAVMDVLGRPGFQPPELSDSHSMMQVMLGRSSDFNLSTRREEYNWLLVAERSL